MRKIFIDLGSNKCEITDMFNEYMDDYEIFCFEPNLLLERYYKNKNLNHIQSAAWIQDGEIDFKFDIDSKNYGSTAILTKKTGKFKNVVKVPSVDISNWIKSNFSKDDHIIMKCDIEGAEYYLIPHLHKTDALSFLDVFILETHPNSKLRIDENEFKEKSNNLNEAISYFNDLKRCCIVSDDNEVYRKLFGDLQLNEQNYRFNK